MKNIDQIKIKRMPARRPHVTRFFLFNAVLILCLSACAFSALSARAAVTNNQVSNMGLVGWWTFNEGAGTVANDSSGKANKGTLVASPSWVTGKIGRALSFNSASSQYVNVGSSTTLTGATATYSAWVKFTNFSTTNPIIGGQATGHPEFRASNATTLAICSQGVSCDSLTVSSISTAVWHLMTLTMNGTVATYYIDGSNVGTSTTFSSFTNSTTTIAAATELSQYMNGAEDDVRIYNRVLSATEVKELYNSGLNLNKINAPATSLQNGSSIASGITGYWTFDGKNTTWTSATAATTADVSGSGNTGTLTSMSQSTSTAEGKIGQALSFDGAASYVDIPMAVSYSAITVSAWMQPSNVSAGDNPRIVSNDHTDSDNKGFQLMYNNGGATGFFDIGNGSAEGRATWSQQLANNTWYLYTGVYDGSHVYAYINDVQVASATLTGSIAASGIDVNIGRDGQYAGDYFLGKVDDVRIYSRALSAAEVKTLYNLGK